MRRWTFQIKTYTTLGKVARALSGGSGDKAEDGEESRLHLDGWLIENRSLSRELVEN
jgi:hypothetical protein